MATAEEAREIMKIGVWYNSVDETLKNLGMPPNRGDDDRGFMVWETDGKKSVQHAMSDSHPMAYCMTPPPALASDEVRCRVPSSDSRTGSARAAVPATDQRSGDSDNGSTRQQQKQPVPGTTLRSPSFANGNRSGSINASRCPTDPWTSGVLPRKDVELISLAVNAACTNLSAEGTRRHIRGALEAGATREEILMILKIASLLSIHTCSLGAPILLEEAKAAGVKLTPKDRRRRRSATR